MKKENIRNFEDAGKESFECNFCYFETESFEHMKRHRRNFHNEDFSLLWIQQDISCLTGTLLALCVMQMLLLSFINMFSVNLPDMLIKVN